MWQLGFVQFKETQTNQTNHTIQRKLYKWKRITSIYFYGDMQKQQIGLIEGERERSC